jgi:hypothetical protein
MNMGMLWYAFSMQKEPVRKKEEMIKEWYRWHKKMAEGRNGGKEQFRAPFASPNQDEDQPTSTVFGQRKAAEEHKAVCHQLTRNIWISKSKLQNVSDTISANEVWRLQWQWWCLRIIYSVRCLFHACNKFPRFYLPLQHCIRMAICTIPASLRTVQFAYYCEVESVVLDEQF